MPAPSLQALADKAGKSMKDAESYFNDARKQRMKDTGKSKNSLGSDDYKFIMGIVKKRLGLPTKKAESIIESAVKSVDKGILPRQALDIALGEDFLVRTFFDSGVLCFATLEDVLIDPKADARIETISWLVNENDWPNNHPIHGLLDSYEGSFEELYVKVAEVLNLQDGV